MAPMTISTEKATVKAKFFDCSIIDMAQWLQIEDWSL